MSLIISSRAKKYPRLSYESMKNAVLGKGYELSLTFLGEKSARDLNLAHRKASYVPNVLSFPLSKKAGEIYIAPKVANRESKKYELSPEGYIGFLFIHGLLHLKGYPHGATMDKAEKKYMKAFRLK
jgi:probable rRNA maturation factor